MTSVMIALAVWLVLRKVDAFAARLFLIAMLPAGVIIVPGLVVLGMIWVADRLGDGVYVAALVLGVPLLWVRFLQFACARTPLLASRGGGGGGSDDVEV